MRLPPDSISIRIVFAPASNAFSRSSLTTEAGRSTTSPAAILLATASGNMRIRLILRAHQTPVFQLPYLFQIAQLREASVRHLAQRRTALQFQAELLRP